MTGGSSVSKNETVITFPTRQLGKTPSGAYLDPIDQQIALTGLPVDDRHSPCERMTMIDGEPVYSKLPTDKCVMMDPAREWHGVWINGYEHSVFCPDVDAQDQCDKKGGMIWLTNEHIKDQVGNVYLVSFTGRKTTHSGGYGHMGEYDSEVIVDRLISMRELIRKD